MFKRIREEIREDKKYGIPVNNLDVVFTTIWRVVKLPFALFGKIYTWVYYDDVNEKLDRIERNSWR